VLTSEAIARTGSIGQTARVIGRALLCGLATVAASASCTGEHGGAVELSWRLRPAEGLNAQNSQDNPCSPFVCCDQTGSGTGPITGIQLGWQIGQVVGDASWACNLGDGTADPATYSSPAAIERTVIAGDAIDLGAVELLLQVSSCTQQTCICAPP
jgi:hypothetical protein